MIQWKRHWRLYLLLAPYLARLLLFVFIPVLLSLGLVFTGCTALSPAEWADFSLLPTNSPLFYPISAAKRVRAALLFSSCAWQLASKKGNRKALKNMR
jgi:ABC-type sugar transport system permease subunit